MRPPHPILLLLALTALALPVDAQTKGNPETAATVGRPGKVGFPHAIEGVSPIGHFDATVAPLHVSGALTPTFPAPDISPDLTPPPLRIGARSADLGVQPQEKPGEYSKDTAPIATRASPVDIDLASFQQYIDEIFGGFRTPTEREVDSLIDDWLEGKGIAQDSRRAAAMRKALDPGKAARAEEGVAFELNAALRPHGALLGRIAAEHRVTLPYVESVIIDHGMLKYFGNVPAASLEKQIVKALTNAELDRSVASYPDNAQGALMRAVRVAMGAKSGNSVEEIARAGAFLYADFSGGAFVRGHVGRDPDVQGHTIVFYITRKDGKWLVSGYRQNVKNRAPDLTYINGLKTWLRDGGISSSDFL
ncbi:MAG: hypothetical protein AAB268_05285 [Elusimicrobiota bacterium]